MRKSREHWGEDWERRLADAIIYQAAKDYKQALLCENRPTTQSLERFFTSGWYDCLTDLHPQTIMKGVREWVDRIKANRRRAV